MNRKWLCQLIYIKSKIDLGGDTGGDTNFG